MHGAAGHGLWRTERREEEFMLNRLELKQQAKGIVRGAQVNAYLFTLLYMAVNLLLNLADRYTSSGWIDEYINIGGIQYSIPTLFPHAPFSGTVVIFTSLLIWLIQCVLQAGWTQYHLGVQRGEVMGYSTLLDSVYMAGKIILLQLVTTLFIFLWSLLFIIPGIVAVYRYRFALYNLCEDPDMGIMDAIRLSKEQTMGYKGDLFLLDLSFLGWLLLSACTAGLLGIWLSPYMAQTDIAYFRAIKQTKGMGTLPGQSGPEADDVFRTDDRFSGPGF